MRKTYIALQISLILCTFVLRAEVCTTVVQISARNTKAYKIARNLQGYIYFPHFTTFHDQALQFH